MHELQNRLEGLELNEDAPSEDEKRELKQAVVEGFQAHLEITNRRRWH